MNVEPQNDQGTVVAACADDLHFGVVVDADGLRLEIFAPESLVSVLFDALLRLHPGLQNAHGQQNLILTLIPGHREIGQVRVHPREGIHVAGDRKE